MLKFAQLFIAAWLFALAALAQSDLNNGKALLQQGKIVEALGELQKAVKTFPKNADAWYWLGEAYLQSGKPDSAEFAAEKALDLDKKLAAGYLLSAKINLARQDLSLAKERLRAGLKYNSKNTTLRMLLGKVLAESDSLDQAIVAYSRVKLLEPKNPAIYEALGDVYQKQPGGVVIATLHYEEAAKLDSLRAGVHYKLARAHLSQRRYNDAAREYRKVSGLDTTNHAALLELATLYFEAKQYANTAAYLETYVRRNPDSREAWARYWEALYSSRQYEKVLAIAPEALKFMPDSADALKMLAHAQFEQREYEQAVATYQQLKTGKLLATDDLKRLAKAYTETQRDSLAVRGWEEVVQQQPNDADAYGELGTLLMRQRQFDKAATAFEKRFTFDSTAVSAYLNYALSNMALSKWDLSRRALQRALQLKSDYLKGWLYLARCYSQIDSLAPAKSACEMVIKLAASEATHKDELAEAHGLIGLVWLVDKKYPEALESLNTSIRLINDNSQTRLWRAQALALANRREEAIPEYQAVLRLDPQNQAAKKDLAMLSKQ